MDLRQMILSSILLFGFVLSSNYGKHRCIHSVSEYNQTFMFDLKDDIYSVRLFLKSALALHLREMIWVVFKKCI